MTRMVLGNGMIILGVANGPSKTVGRKIFTEVYGSRSLVFFFFNSYARLPVSIFFTNPSRRIDFFQS